MLFCKTGEYHNNKLFLFKLTLSNISYTGALNGHIVFKMDPKLKLNVKIGKKIQKNSSVGWSVFMN